MLPTVEEIPKLPGVAIVVPVKTITVFIPIEIRKQPELISQFPGIIACLFSWVFVSVIVTVVVIVVWDRYVYDLLCLRYNDIQAEQGDNQAHQEQEPQAVRSVTNTVPSSFLTLSFLTSFFCHYITVT